MNFLTLCQTLRRECGISGTGPSTVISQTGEMERVVSWIAQSWLEIALLHREWRWLLRDKTFALTASQQAYVPASAPVSLTDFGSWKAAPYVWRVYKTATGTASENYLDAIDYEDFRNYYLFGSRRTEEGEPICMSVRPYDNALLFGPIPPAGYTAVGQYYASPTELAIDADIPAMPTRFHMAIVYLAMQKYGAFESAPEVYQRGEVEYKRMLSQLEADQLEAPTLAGPLA